MSRYQWIEPQIIERNWNLNPRSPDNSHIKTIARHMHENGYDTDFPIVGVQG